jgi:hypothetical protein
VHQGDLNGPDRPSPGCTVPNGIFARERSRRGEKPYSTFDDFFLLIKILWSQFENFPATFLALFGWRRKNFLLP